MVRLLLLELLLELLLVRLLLVELLLVRLLLAILLLLLLLPPLEHGKEAMCCTTTMPTLISLLILIRGEEGQSLQHIFVDSLVGLKAVPQVV